MRDEGVEEGGGVMVKVSFRGSGLAGRVSEIVAV